MGKYDAVMHQLKKLPREETPYQKKVDEAKLEFAGLTTSAKLATQYTKLRKQEEKLEEDAKALELRLEALTQLMEVSFDSENIRTLSLASGGSVELRPEPYASVKDKPAFKRWAEENGYGDQLTLAWMTTNAIAKERLLAGQCEITEDGEVIPVPGVHVFMKPKPYWRKK